MGKNIAELLAFTAELLARILLHFIVLAAWALNVSALGYILRVAELSDTDRISTVVIQHACTITILSPIGFMYWDFRSMLNRGRGGQ